MILPLCVNLSFGAWVMRGNQVETIAPYQLDLRLGFLRPSSCEHVNKMAESLSRHSQLTPIAVVREGDRIILVDGFKRQKAAVRLHLDSLEARVIAADISHAKAMVYLLNRTGSFTMINEALLVRELVLVDGLNQVETARLLDRHKSFVCRRLMMIRALAPEVIEDLRLGMLPAGVGPFLARLPQCNQSDFTSAIQTHNLRSQEISKLIDLWCKTSDPAVRQCLISSPRQALEITREGQEDEQRKWLNPIQSIFKNIAALNRKLQESKVLPHVAITMQQLLEQAESQIQQTRKLIMEKKNESFK